MTTINTSSPLASYLASAGKATTATTASSQEKPAESSKDPIAELRSLARQMVARSEGGLLRALNGGGSLQPSVSQSLSGSKAGESGGEDRAARRGRHGPRRCGQAAGAGRQAD